jgi:hypothetical protein
VNQCINILFHDTETNALYNRINGPFIGTNNLNFKIQIVRPNELDHYMCGDLV